MRDSTMANVERRSLLLTALAAGLSLPAAFAASNVAAQSKPLVVGFTIWDLSIPFAVPLANSLKKTAQENNIDLKLVDARWDASTQAAQIEQFIVQKVDVICATPIDVRGILPAAQSARDAGVPLIACGGVVEGFPYIGADDLEFGRKMGQLILDALKQSSLPGPYNIAFLRGAPGGAPDRLRREGIMSVIGSHDDIKVVAEIVTDWKPEEGLSGTQDLLQKFPIGQLHLIHGWGGMVEVPAARYAHNVAGRPEILFTGGELTIQTKEAIENGWEYGVIIQDPTTLGNVIMTTVPKMAPEFTKVPPEATVPLPTCTKENLSQFQPF